MQAKEYGDSGTSPARSELKIEVLNPPFPNRVCLCMHKK